MRVPRTTGGFSGVAIVVLGLWGALVPFVGPYFHYAFGNYDAWHFTTNRFWLDVLPGALAVIGGLLLLRAATRKGGLIGGWLALIAGGWFAVGPTVSLLWDGAGNPIGAPVGGQVQRTLELLGYFHLLGFVIATLAAFAGAASSRVRGWPRSRSWPPAPSPARSPTIAAVAAFCAAGARPTTPRLRRADPLPAQLLARRIGLRQFADTHRVQHLGRLRELDVAVVHHLDVVAPRVDKVEAPAGPHGDAALQQGGPHRLLVVHDEADVAALVRLLRPPRRQGEELVPHVHEGHPPAGPPAQLEPEEPPVPLQRRVDVVDLQRHVVNAEKPGHCARQ